jgi:lariat debranching enzyme
MEKTEKQKLKVAIVGCLHGKLKDIYEELKEYETKHNEKIDFLICCGDFQVNIT